MAVPARNEAHATAPQNLVFVDDVFKHLVQGVAHVQGSVGIGRSVVKSEARPFVVQTQLVIDAVVGPKGLQFRLTLGGVRTHAKTGLQQVERVLVGGTSLVVGALLLAHRLLVWSGDYQSSAAGASFVSSVRS